MVCTSVGISYIPEVDHKTNKQRYASCYSMILTDMTSWVTGEASFGTFCNGKGEDNIGMFFYMCWMRSHTFCKWRMEKTVLTCCLAGIRQDCIPPVSRWGRRWCIQTASGWRRRRHQHAVLQVLDQITYILEVGQQEGDINMLFCSYWMRSHTPFRRRRSRLEHTLLQLFSIYLEYYNQSYGIVTTL